MAGAVFLVAVLLVLLSQGPDLASATIKTDDIPVNAHWMGELRQFLYNHTLFDILLPGTHDSGAYELFNEFAPDTDRRLDRLVEIANAFGIPTFELVRVWALAQNLTIYEQLYAGARYIDFRACVDAKHAEWRTMHMLLGNPSQLLLDDIRRFLHEFPTEVIFVEVSHFGNASREEKVLLADMIYATLGEYLFPRTRLLNRTTIGEMVASNQRAVVVFDDEYIVRNYAFLWPDDILTGSYANTPDVNVMVNWNQDEIARLGMFVALLLCRCV